MEGDVCEIYENLTSNLPMTLYQLLRKKTGD